MTEYGLREAFDAGWQAALEYCSGVPNECAFIADAAQRALDVRIAREEADERLRRLDAAEGQGVAAYDTERARQGLLPYARARAAA